MPYIVQTFSLPDTDFDGRFLDPTRERYLVGTYGRGMWWPKIDDANLYYLLQDAVWARNAAMDEQAIVREVGPNRVLLPTVIVAPLDNLKTATCPGYGQACLCRPQPQDCWLTQTIPMCRFCAAIKTATLSKSGVERWAYVTADGLVPGTVNESATDCDTAFNQALDKYHTPDAKRVRVFVAWNEF